jgi:uncharacterized damage-inducible protein DinB
MNAADFARLYAYNDWANERMLAAIGTLSDEQAGQPIVSSFASIRETLDHIAFAEWLWLGRFKGDDPTPRPEWQTLDELRDVLRSVALERGAFLATLTDDAVAATIDYRSTNGDPFSAALGDILFHCANHSTYHRGQLVTMLRQVGAVPPGTDFMPFTRSG